MPYNTTAIPPRQEPTGQTQLPLSRVKKIISQDPEIHMCSNNAAFVITLATEMFIQHLTEEAHVESKMERKPRRNIQYKDVASAISHHDNLEFVEDVAPKTIPFKKAKAAANAAQARLRGEQVPDDRPGPSQGQLMSNGGGSSSSSSTTTTTTTNGHGHGKAGINGESSNPFTLSLRAEQQQEDDPSDQLDREMRRAAGPHRDGDVDMTG